MLLYILILLTIGSSKTSPSLCNAGGYIAILSPCLIMYLSPTLSQNSVSLSTYLTTKTPEAMRKVSFTTLSVESTYMFNYVGVAKVVYTIIQRRVYNISIKVRSFFVACSTVNCLFIEKYKSISRNFS